MRMKRLMAMALVLAMGTAMAACGNNESSGNQSQVDTAAASTDAPASASEEAGGQDSQAAATEGVSETAASGDYNVTWEDTAEIVVLYPSMTSIPSGLQAVEDAINEITEAEINTHVTLNMIEVGNYEQQANLMVSSNEKLDLMITLPGGPTSFSTMASQHQLLDVGELMDAYAPTLKATVGDLVNGLQVDGVTYGFPLYKGYAGSIDILMRTDVLEDLGMVDKAKDLTSFSEFEEILEAVKNSEKWGYLSGIAACDGHGSVLPSCATVAYADNFADTKVVDNLGNTQFAVCVEDGNNTVVNTYATDMYRNNYELIKSWYDKGYVYKDSATTQEMGASLVKSNITFSYVNAVELGNEAAVNTSCGMDMTWVKIVDMPISTGSITKFTWAIPTTAREPEAAATFLELMFTDARVANLFAWGIEGVDYEVGDDGVARFIEGNENPAYHAVDFLNPNGFLLHPWDGQEPNANEIRQQYMEEATYSPYLGFSADTSAVSDTVSAITNAMEQYTAQITSGVATEETYQEFLDKLEIGGIDQLVSLYQEALDAWLEATGK